MSDHEFSLSREARLLVQLGGLERIADILRRHLGDGTIKRASEYHDKQGADGWWVRRGRSLAIDWKLRDKEYDDLVVEWMSRVEHNALGWTVDPYKITDYVLYIWPKTARLLPAKALREAAIAKASEWQEGYGIVAVTTEERYTTRFSAIPDAVVLAAMKRPAEPRDFRAEHGRNADGTWGELGWFTEVDYGTWA